ncbi:FGGY-family carbohydrate kinase [Roseovarius mucosus]|uniref:FGGY-family carbohydrate kinase n=1 Tax=Roseovarius mucosus TaxID=215743 RepID=UPI003F705713
MAHFIGVDVGTGSVRAGVFDARGALCGTGLHPISLYRGSGQRVEQSSAEIWDGVCHAVRAARAQAGLTAAQIAGIGFDATCSLVLLGTGGQGLPASPDSPPERDVIVWMDHRATAQAAQINATGHAVLDYVGGQVSPEMQVPKLLWLHQHHRATFDQVWQFLDLSDFLTWRATGSLARSSCTVTCKWTYVAGRGGWDPGFFDQIGLGTLAMDGFARIGAQVVDPGSALGEGLTVAAAAELDLIAGTPVGAGLIDAHAGGLGTVGAPGGSPFMRMAYVFGTSSCTMTTTRGPVFVPGIWGPYRDAMLPGAWLLEGGQSTAGAAIAHLLRHHPAWPQAEAQASAVGQSVSDWLVAELETRDMPTLMKNAAELHVVPEFLGNRAPFANPHTRAVIAGLGMDDDLPSLTRLYLAGLTGLGYGLRQLLEAQDKAGVSVSSLVISGGAGRSPLVRQILADTIQKPIEVPATPEPVLLGAAILGALASGAYPDADCAMATMCRIEHTHHPNGDAICDLHERRYAIYVALQAVSQRAASENGRSEV